MVDAGSTCGSAENFLKLSRATWWKLLPRPSHVPVNRFKSAMLNQKRIDWAFLAKVGPLFCSCFLRNTQPTHYV